MSMTTPRSLEYIAVYGGSASGAPALYYEAATRLGQVLATRGIGIVYGGGKVGMMGAVADGALAAGGEVIGVITEKLADIEVGHEGLTRLEVVTTMHPRKARMAELADGFIAMPGGWGTLEEIFEAVTWSQLNDHIKPCALYDVHGFWSELDAFLDRATETGFIRAAHRDLLARESDPERLIEALETQEIPTFGRWLAGDPV
jgi:uncharacterized protein (TIGR00730 family)